MEMTHGSLFSGIGGFDLASKWMGWENKFHCEWNEFGQKVLKYYWPEAELFTDITKSNFTKYANKIDILTGGFPCQPYSSAGKRLGKEDSRHLWPEMLRAIREIQPRWVVGENVRGLTNWNGGLVFDEVYSDLEAQGYEVLPFLLPAAAVNAPHRRDRIWFVAYSKSIRWNGGGSKHRKNSNENSNRICEYGQEQCSMGCEFKRPCKKSNATYSNSNGFNKCNSEHEVNTSEAGEYAQRDTQSSNDNGDATDSLSIRLQQCRERSKSSNAIETNGEIRDASNTNNSRFKTFNNEESKLGEKNRAKTFSRNSIESLYSRTRWKNFPSVSPICSGYDGLSDRLDNITFPKWRNESIKAGGNAIVPQVVYQIFKAIEQYELILLNEGITNTISDNTLA